MVTIYMKAYVMILLLLLHPFTPASSSSTPFILQTNPSSYSSELNILTKIYEEQDGDKKRFLVRNVPGYGSCLFYSLAACITFDRCYKHLVFHTKRMKLFVAQLRLKAVEELKDNTDPNRFFHLDNDQKMSVQDVLKAAAYNVHMKETDYLKEMLQSKTWGGGPEIVALSNYFKRPIHVYELCRHTSLKSFFRLENEFKLKLCAKFGSPIFDKENETPYCILCADGRFPHVFPGMQKQKGDHFLALFPVVPVNNEENESSHDINDKRSTGNNGVKGGEKQYKLNHKSNHHDEKENHPTNRDDNVKTRTRLRQVIVSSNNKKEIKSSSSSSSSSSALKQFNKNRLKKNKKEENKYAYDYYIHDKDMLELHNNNNDNVNVKDYNHNSYNDRDDISACVFKL